MPSPRETPRAKRHAALLAEVERLGHVPSVRVMAVAVQAAPWTVARDYRDLGLSSNCRAGRPPAARAQVVEFRLPAPIYDRFYRLAKHREASVASVVRAYVLAAFARSDNKAS